MTQDNPKDSFSSVPAVLPTSSRPHSKLKRVRSLLKSFIWPWLFPILGISLLGVLISLTLLTFRGAAERGFVKKLDQHIDTRIEQHPLASERALAELKLKSQQATDTIEITRQLATQLSQLSSRFTEAQNHQQALENFYTALTHDREGLILIEIEQILSTVNEQLPLTGNTSLALSALETADRRLAAFDSARSKAVRHAISHDLAALKAMPRVDFAELASALDHAYQQVDTLPLAGDTAMVPKAATTATTANATSNDVSHAAGWKATLERFNRDIMNQLKSLVQIRRLDNADIMRISPDQSVLLRENLKLRLLSARLSLLLHRREVISADLKSAETIIVRYFDSASPATQTMHSLIQQVQRLPENLKLPNLDMSLQALRQSEAHR